MTGIATDIGIEMGRLVYWNRNATATLVKANRDKLFIHCAILMSFFSGGMVGALAFKAVGFAATIPIACTLAMLALPPILVDLRLRRFVHRSAHGRQVAPTRCRRPNVIFGPLKRDSEQTVCAQRPTVSENAPASR